MESSPFHRQLLLIKRSQKNLAKPILPFLKAFKAPFRIMDQSTGKERI